MQYCMGVNLKKKKRKKKEKNCNENVYTFCQCVHGLLVTVRFVLGHYQELLF